MNNVDPAKASASGANSISTDHAICSTVVKALMAESCLNSLNTCSTVMPSLSAFACATRVKRSVSAGPGAMT